LPLTACEYLPAQLPALAVDYVEDEAELPIAVQRRLNRERRQAQMNRQTKDSIRKQKARERSALIMQMIKYISAKQLTVEEFDTTFCQKLNPSNKWVILANTIP
jgi:hypothetical protein